LEKAVIVIPTYNEKENIEVLLNKLLNLGENLRIIVVDDFSPDGTGEVVEEYSKKYQNIEIIKRKERGRGTAGIVGFKKALEKNIPFIIEMDADLSHSPETIPVMLKEIENFDVIIGSRYIKGGKEINRSFFRRMISYLANLYLRILLGVKIKDCTSGFRCYKREVLKSINLENTISKGPAIVSEILYKIHLKKFRIKEIPIVYRDREKGKSTLTFKILLETFFDTLKYRLKSKLNT
jgi:dolichol-phosphate mannosyltransferase